MPAKADSENQQGTRRAPEHLILSGPEHLRITGANGSGKTTLAGAIAHAGDPEYRSPVQPAYRVGYCLEGRTFLSASPSTRSSPSLKPYRGRIPVRAEQHLRDQLARLLFRRERAP